MALEQKSDLSRAVWPSDPKHYQWKGTLSYYAHNGIWHILAHCKPRKQDVFIKIKETQNTADADIDQFTESTKNLINIQHANLLTPIHAFVHKSEIWVIYPRHSGGPLTEVLSSHYPNGIPDETIVASILYDICHGLRNLHKQQQCHRNIRASSIHIDIDSGRALLSEFGELKEIKWRHAAGRRNTFVAPEREPFTDPLILLGDESASWYAGDMYAFGITALQLTYGSVPAMNTKALLHNKSAHTISVDLYDRKCPFSKAFEALIKDCCAPKKENRISINKLCEHKFFSKLNLDNAHVAIKQYFGHILKSTEKRINSALSAPKTFTNNGTIVAALPLQNKENTKDNINANTKPIEDDGDEPIEVNEDTKSPWSFSTTIRKDEIEPVVNGPTMHNTMPTQYTTSHDNTQYKTKRNYHVSFSGSESISQSHDPEYLDSNTPNVNGNNQTVQINRFKVEFDHDSRMSDSSATHIEPSQTNDEEYEIEQEHDHDSDHEQNTQDNSEQTTQIKRFFITPAKPEQETEIELSADASDHDELQIQIKPKTKWSANECSQWVGSLGDLYKQYMKPFIDNGIDGALLAEIDDDTLKEIITSGLHRKKILLAWAQLQQDK
eukprot:318340_1